MASLLAIVGRLVEDAFRWVLLLFRSKDCIQAENFLLRRQLALYIERGNRPGRIDPATRISLAVLARLFDWRSTLVVVKPETMRRWHRAGWRLLWQTKSRRGRPPIAKELRELIRRMASENLLWGEERIANELLLKLDVRISPRTVSKYLPKRPRGGRRGEMRWSTFLKTHTKAIRACDFIGTATARMWMLRAATRRLAQVSEAAHSCVAWTIRQLKEVSANAGCAEMRGPRRRECPGWIILTSEAPLRLIQFQSASPCDGRRPNGGLESARGPPEGSGRPMPRSPHRWALRELVRSKPTLAGLRDGRSPLDDAGEPGRRYRPALKPLPEVSTFVERRPMIDRAARRISAEPAVAARKPASGR
jgi:hypothetical protein